MSHSWLVLVGVMGIGLFWVIGQLAARSWFVRPGATRHAQLRCPTKHEDALVDYKAAEVSREAVICDCPLRRAGTCDSSCLPLLERASARLR